MPSWSVADLVPGLVFLVGAGGLSWVLRRFYDPLPRLLLALFALSVLVAFRSVLLGGQILLPLDLLRAQVPFQGVTPVEPHANYLQGDLLQLTAATAAEVHRAVAAGHWPLISDRAGGGMPLLGDPHSQALQPLALADWLLPAEQAAGVIAALRIFACLAFTLAFLRRQGLELGAALVGAVAWSFGGFLMLWLGWPHANSAVLLPASLYALVLVDERGSRADFCLLTGVLAALALAGHPETILYITLLLLAFLLARLRRARKAGEPAAGRAAASVAVAAGLAFALAAPALLPAAAALPESLRSRNVREGAPPSAPSPESPSPTAAKRLLPLLAPNAFGNNLHGPYWGASNVNEDASGFLGTGAVLLVLLALARRRGSRRPQELFFASIAALTLLVVALPVWLGGALDASPWTRISDHHHRLILLAGWSLAYLAACEVDRWQRVGAARWRAIAAAALVALGLLWAYGRASADGAAAELEIFRHGMMLWQLRFLALALLLLLALARRRLLGPALAACLAGELLLTHLPAYPPAPDRLSPGRIASPALAFLRANAGGDRVVAQDLALLPNLGMLFGLADLRVYNPMAPAAYFDTLRPLLTGWSVEVPILGRFDHPLYDRLGVGWVLVPHGTAPPPGLAIAFEDPSGDVWRRPFARPRLFLEGLEGAAAADSLALESLEPAHLRARVEVSQDRLLATSLYQDGGWRVLRNGARLPGDRSGGVFLGARLASGEGRLDVLYRPPGFALGLALAALGLTTLTAFCLPRPEPPPL